MIADIDKIFSVVDYCITVEVIGGEPFIYTDLKRVLEHLVKMPQIFMVEITTNGIMIPKADLIGILQDKKVYIPISDYGKINEIKKTNLILFLNKNSINYEVIETSDWFDSGGIEKRNKSKIGNR